MSSPSPEQVFPAAPGGPPAATSSGGALAKLRGVDKRVWAGAGVAVVLVLGFVANRRGSSATPETDPTDDGDAAGTYTLDTSDTDIYTELQPELEQIGDDIEGLQDRPRPATPKPATANQPHHNGQSPKPTGPHAVRRTYMVKKGDTISGVAKKFKLRGGAPRLYGVNRAIIRRAAIEHKLANPRTTRKLVPGTVLVIP